MHNIKSSVRLGCIMREFDDTTPDETPTIDQIAEVVANNAVYALHRMDDLEKRIRELEAALADLHNDRAQRLQQQDLEDPEWY